MRYILSIFLLLIKGLGVYAQHIAVSHNGDSTFNTVRELQEVVVTAEKRELKPLDIPTALTVITSRSMTGENTPDLRNISGIVPNFYMQEGGLKLSTPIYIRGVGTVSGTPPVGLYVDGVPVFDKNAFVFELYDISRIEVLRGPQTTLYGRNSINGLIHITTQAPAKDFSLKATAGYASYNSRNYQLVANLPSRIVYNKLSFAYQKSGGYFKNHYDHNRKSNPSDSYNLRYHGIAYAARDWKIAFGVNFSHSFDGGYAYYVADSLKNNRYLVNYNTPSSYKRELFSGYANVKKNWNRFIFQGVTSYSWTKDQQIFDADFTYLDVFDNNKKSGQNLFTQEINLQSAAGSRWNWTIGVFGFYKDLTNKYLAAFGKDKAYLLPMALDEAKYQNNTVTSGLAGYGQITLQELWSGMSFTAGLRYDCEKSRLDYADSLLFTLATSYEKYHESDESKVFTAWLPKFSLLQKCQDNLSLFLSISKGYRAGGYNIIVNDMSSQMVKLGYKEEKLWNYELGMKYFSSNGKFHINLAAFFIDWKDQQIFVMGMMGPGIKNAGDAHSYGGEMDIRWQFLPDLTYLLSAGYSHSRYYNNEEKSHEGNHIVMAPEFTTYTGLSYHRAIRASWCNSFFASTTVNGFGKQYFDEANLLKQMPYFLWNMELGISGKYFDFRIWGKNILDKAFFAYMLNNPVGNKLPSYRDMGQSGAPARFGASITLKIN